MKRIHFTSTFLTLIILILSGASTFAQFPGMQKVYSTIGTPHQQLNMNSPMGFKFYNSSLSQVNHKQDFTLVMKDSSKVEVSSKIYIDTAGNRTYVLLVDKSLGKKDPRRERKIYADQTLKISRIQIERNYEVMEKREVVGIATDSCWLFHAVTGKINAYSYLGIRDKNSSFGVPETICAMQVDNGPIVTLNEANLTAAVGRNEYVLALIKQKEFYKAIKRYNKDFEKANKK